MHALWAGWVSLISGTVWISWVRSFQWPFFLNQKMAFISMLAVHQRGLFQSSSCVSLRPLCRLPGLISSLFLQYAPADWINGQFKIQKEYDKRHLWKTGRYNWLNIVSIATKTNMFVLKAKRISRSESNGLVTGIVTLWRYIKKQMLNILCMLMTLVKVIDNRQSKDHRHSYACNAQRIIL